MRGQAEIVGAGLAGLAAAIALADSGWTVTVHESGPELREIGAGLYVWENGIRVLDALGVLDDMLPRAHRVPRFDIVDERVRLVQRLPFSDEPGNRLIIVLRAELHRALVNRATALGVELRTSSRVLAAAADGTIELEDGTTRRADLVVGADGVNSAVRTSLDLLKRRRSLIDGAIRLLIPRHATEFHDPTKQACVEYWNRNRRILYTPAGPEHIYLCFTTRVSDDMGHRLPLDLPLWKENFPMLADELDRITPETPARWDGFSMVGVTAWSKGRSAIVGDAVHAQPPNLGQGAGLAMSTALGLAWTMRHADDVVSGLAEWERRERDIVAHTQRWTWLWGVASAAVPPQFPRLRSSFVRSLANRPWVARNVERTAKHAPTGTVSPGGQDEVDV
jgi:2-polyprenyl-6-methoxyphenol hydroxylase-like FAD-dependent oxidoreductase